MNHGTTARPALILGLQSGLIMGAVIVGQILRLGSSRAPEVVGAVPGLLNAALVALACHFCLSLNDLYDLRVLNNRRTFLIRVLKSLFAISMILAGLYFWFPAIALSPGAVVPVVVVVAGWRIVSEWLTRFVNPAERWLLVGATTGSVDLARELIDRREELGVDIVGFVDADSACLGARIGPLSVIGTIDEIPSIVRERSIDRVVVSLADARGRMPMEALLEMKLGGVSFDHLASAYERYTGKIAIENLRPSWFIFSRGFHKSVRSTIAKRTLDLVIATAGLLTALPIMALVAVLVPLTSRGPVFYTQRRVGESGRLFTIRKFRTMKDQAEAGTGAVWAQANDRRITGLGRWLRKTRLDELPQLWNVLAGDMSLVGPRPERPEFVGELSQTISFYGQRHVVKPGLTGWAQVQYRYGSTVEDALQKLQYDLYYIKHRSIALDLLVMVKTINIVLMRRGT
jgi:sugar transferase (PEP-CTERM system associated)